MRKFTRTLTCIIALSTITSVAIADEDAELVVNGELNISTKAAAPADSALDELISGWRFRTDETQALQMDDFDNPSFIFIEPNLISVDNIVLSSIDISLCERHTTSLQMYQLMIIFKTHYMGFYAFLIRYFC